MAIIGNIIKGVINLTGELSSDSNPVEEQEAVLKSLLTTAKDTKFGKTYQFESILKS